MSVTPSPIEMTRTAPRSTHWLAIYAFARAILWASIRNWRTTLSFLLAPLLMLVVFRYFGGDSEMGQYDMFTYLFPGIVTMTVMFAGVPLATRLVVWREQEIFRRLACTPQPLGRLVVAMMFSYLIVAISQAVLILAAGLLLFDAGVSPTGIALAFPFLLLATLCFIAYGSMLATFVSKAESATTIYTFTLMPMAFIGTLFMPPDNLPDIVQRVGKWLPTSLAADPIRAAFLDGTLPEQWGLMLAGLIGYTLVFALITSRRFRWQ